MYTVYNLLLNLAFIISFPYLLLRAAWGKHGITERMGRLPEGKVSILSGKKVVWFHAASVGEVKALSAIIPQVQSKYPGYDLVVSTWTKTGKAEAERILKGIRMVFYVPVDLRRFVRRVLGSIRPVALILVETELWPNLIKEAKRSGCFIALINGRISERSLGRYRSVKGLFEETLSCVDLLCLQSREYKERMMLLGAEESRISVTGNLKFDRLLLAAEPEETGRLRKTLHIPEGLRVVIAGSTREGEESILISAFKKLSQRYEDLLFILAPRHLDRLNQVERILSDSEMKFVRRTRLDELASAGSAAGGNHPNSIRLILLDTMGELSKMYSIADLAFVGGSLVPVGGHNLLEPAIYGVPVFFGAHVNNFKEEAKILIESGGGVQVQNQEELFLRLSDLLSNDEQRRNLGRKARQAIEKKTGVAGRTADLVFSALKER
jgi:3-deoxy-D-manno-octulosonic-acid transferase